MRSVSHFHGGRAAGGRHTLLLGLRGMPPKSLVAIPDTDGELAAILGHLEDVLLAVQPYDADDEPVPDDLDPDALTAAQRVIAAVIATERTPATPLYAPDGRFELVPLRFVDLGPADLAALGRAVAALGRATLPAGDELLTQVLAQAADAQRHLHLTPTAVVESFARAHGLLDLRPDADTELLAGLAGATSPVVLTASQYEAYRRLISRVLGMFHAGDPLAPFLYGGT